MRDLADLTERASGRKTKVYMLGTLLEILAPLALTFYIDSTSLTVPRCGVTRNEGR